MKVNDFNNLQSRTFNGTERLSSLAANTPDADALGGIALGDGKLIEVLGTMVASMLSAMPTSPQQLPDDRLDGHLARPRGEASMEPGECQGRATW